MPGNIPYWGSGGILDRVGSALFNEPLVLLGEDGAPFLEPGRDVAFLLDGPAWVNNHIHVLKPNAGVDRRFLIYALNTVDYSAYISGSTRDKLTQDDMWQILIPFISPARQRTIADYLDYETARLDSLVMARRRMVELLDERFGAFAQLVCVGGVGNLERQSSPSGMYGVIPDTWTETPLRHLGCEVQTGPFGSQLHAEEYIEDGWPVVNPMNIVDGRIVAVPGMTVSAEKRAELSRHILAEGDIVFGRRGEMGRAGLVRSAQVGWLCGTGSLRLRITNPALIPAYLKLLLQTPPAKTYFSLSSVGSTMENLNSEIVLAFPTIVPSKVEQTAIVEQVQEASNGRDRLVNVLHQQISLLQERRQTLITAAVTGQLDIVGAA